MNAGRGDPSAQDEQMNASYAADRYARLDGMGAVAVTNAVGSLDAINGVAGVTDAVPQVTSCATLHFAAAMPRARTPTAAPSWPRPPTGKPCRATSGREVCSSLTTARRTPSTDGSHREQ
jgi:pyruvate/2-oxoglutarate dehydrogenase complex dihydrolipoamide acyltransferase (E2) component